MGAELEKRVEDLLETRPAGTKKLEFEVAANNPLGIIERLTKINNPTLEQMKLALLAITASLRDMQISSARNKLLIEKCHLIKEVHSSKMYKGLGMTWEEAAREFFGITRQSAEAYEHVAENLPQYLIDALKSQGAALADLRLLSAEIGKAEGAEIVFLDEPESKAVVVRGNRYPLTMGSDEAIRAMMRFASEQARELEHERRVRAMAMEQAKTADDKLAKEKEETAKLRDRIQNGVKQLKDMEATEFDDRLLELIQAGAKIRAANLTKIDERRLKQYWEVLATSLIDPLKQFFSARINETELDEPEIGGKG